MGFDVFVVLKILNFEKDLTSGFHHTYCNLQNGILNSTCKNRNMRQVSCRWVTNVFVNN